MTSVEPVVRCGAAVRKHSEIRERAARLASALSSLGIGHGDRYAMVMRNSIEFLEASLAGSGIGAIPVPVNSHWTGDDLDHLLTDSGSKLVIVDSDLVSVVEAVLPPGMIVVEVGGSTGGKYPDFESLITTSEPIGAQVLDPPLGVIYTSGTTGKPKGILRQPMTTEQSGQVGLVLMTMLAANPSMSTLIPAPLYHTAPNAHAVFAIALGMNLEIMPRFDPEEFLRLVQDQKIQHAQMVPTMFVRLLKLPKEIRRKYDVSSLQSVVHAAAPCPESVKREMIEWFGPIIAEFYGGSETGGAVVCNSEQWLDHPGTVGHPIADTVVKILDPVSLQELPAGESGDIYIKPFSSWPEFTYIGNDAKRQEMEHDGFLTVGDIGYVDTDGFLFLNDRRNDLINSGGVNIYPAEIEGCLVAHDAIADAAVFGVPDEEFGEAIAAHIELSPGASLNAEDVKDFVRAHLAGYKIPKVIVFEDKLPREDTGKLFKRKLKEPYWNDQLSRR